MTKILLYAGIGFITILTICIVLLYSKGDSLGKRQRIIAQLSEYRDRLRSNPADTQALHAIIAMLEDDSAFARRSAAGMLGEIGLPGVKAVSVLASALGSEDDFLANEAASSLCSLGTNASGAIPELISALKRGNCSTACYSAKALGKIRLKPEIVVPALVQCLDVHDLDHLYGDPGVELAFEAADALAQYGSDATVAIPELKRRLVHPNSTFRLHLAIAIVSISAQDVEALQIVTDYIYDKKMNSKTLFCLAKAGANAKVAVPVLEKYVNNPALAPNVREHAIDTLNQLKKGQ